MPPLVITAYNGGAATPFTVPKTPWGDPDFQGVWSSDDATMPMSRPMNFADRLYLNDEEFAARQKQIENGVKVDRSNRSGRSYRSDRSQKNDSNVPNGPNDSNDLEDFDSKKHRATTVRRQRVAGVAAPVRVPDFLVREVVALHNEREAAGRASQLRDIEPHMR